LVEGVHNGSNGPIFYSTAVLSQHDREWNGVSVTIPQHPVDNQGQPIRCADDPNVYDRLVVGRVFNAHMDGPRLRAELWLDRDRLRELDPVLLARIQRGEPVDVSTGFIPIAITETGGTWRNEEYVTEILEMRPDHLAVLPHEVGACSLQDGCGIRNRKETANGMTDIEKHNETTDPVESDSPDDPKEDEDAPATNCSERSHNKTGEEKPVGNGGESEMKDDEKKVTANAEPVPEPKKEPEIAPVVAPKEEPMVPAVVNAELTPEELIKRLPVQYQEVLSNGLDLLNQRKAELIASITNATGNQFTECELKAKSVPELTKLSALIQKPSSDGPIYVGNAGVPVDNANDMVPLALPSLADLFPAKK